jgi:hypothetical protein
MVIVGLELSGGAALAMLGFVLTVGAVFISLVRAMRRQQPSLDGGDLRAAEDHYDPEEAIPLEIDDERVRRDDLERWSNDGAPAQPRL